MAFHKNVLRKLPLQICICVRFDASFIVEFWNSLCRYDANQRVRSRPRGTCQTFLSSYGTRQTFSSSMHPCVKLSPLYPFASVPIYRALNHLSLKASCRRAVSSHHQGLANKYAIRFQTRVASMLLAPLLSESARDTGQVQRITAPQIKQARRDNNARHPWPKSTRQSAHTMRHTRD